MKKLNFAGVFGILLASSLTIMVGSALTPALPEIGAHFGLGNQSSWLVTMPALGVIIGSLFCGRLLKKAGARKTCIIGLFLYGLFGSIGCFMPSVMLELLDRLLLGVTTAFIMTSGTALISQFYQGEKQLKMIAVQGMAIELGGVIFLSIGGYLALISWKAAYGIYLIAFVAMLLLLFFVPCVENDTAETADEIKSAVAFDNDSLKKSPVQFVFLFAFLGMLIFFTAVVSLPTYLQNIKGFSTAFTGNYLAAISLIAVVFAGIMPKYVKRFSAKTSLLTAYSCYTLAHLLLYASSQTLLLYAAALFMGIGFGFSTPLVNHLTLERSTPENKAANLSFYSMATFAGQFLSSMIAAVSGGSMIFLVAAVLAAVTWGLVAFSFD